MGLQLEDGRGVLEGDFSQNRDQGHISLLLTCDAPDAEEWPAISCNRLLDNRH